jgi:hypothetical protein
MARLVVFFAALALAHFAAATSSAPKEALSDVEKALLIPACRALIITEDVSPVSGQRWAAPTRARAAPPRPRRGRHPCAVSRREVAGIVNCMVARVHGSKTRTRGRSPA